MATDVIVLFALEREARPFRRCCPEVPVHLTGVGVERARSVVDALLATTTPRLLILAGFGGALTKSSRVGDVVIANDVAEESGATLKCAGAGEGRVLTVNRMIATVEEKLSLGNKYQASVCDMESAAVADLCKMRNVPFLAVRAISDTAERSLPPSLDRLIVNGQVSPWRAVMAMLREPKLIFEFRRLARDTDIAARNLALALTTLLSQLRN